MDPRRQSSTPQQKPFSDFVSTPRPQPGADITSLSQDTSAKTQSTAQTAAGTGVGAAATSQLARSAPATDVIPRRNPTSSTTATGSSSANANPATANSQAKTHTSFALPNMPDVEPRETKTPSPHQGLRDILSIVGVLASALLLAFALITFVFQSYQVDGPSMQTTLQNSDHLIVWKVPKTISKLTGKPYIPNRGDVIIFSEPGSAVGGTDKQLIKRVIALPGERVVVKDGSVTVYNNDFPNGFNPDRTLPYGSVIHETTGNVDTTLKSDEVFAMGDNRSNSLDSRVFGPVKSDQIVGKLVIRILPLNSVKKF